MLLRGAPVLRVIFTYIYRFHSRRLWHGTVCYFVAIHLSVCGCRVLLAYYICSGIAVLTVWLPCGVI